MKIAVLGAGFTGLAAAYELTKKGHKVTVFEKEDKPGGLAAGFQPSDFKWSLEKHYHHLFESDSVVINLIKELGLEKKLFFKRPKTSVFYNGEIYPFSTPLDVLRFGPLKILERFRVGAVSGMFKIMPARLAGWRLEDKTAYEWIKRYYGQKVFKVIWEPLLKGKFGDEARKIGALWFWARIKKRTFKLGYINGGFQILADELSERIKIQGGRVFFGTEVKRLKSERGRTMIYYHYIYNDSKDTKREVRVERRVKNKEGFERVIVTLPSPVFNKITDLPKSYAKSLTSIRYLQALNLILIMKKPFFKDGIYWLNINEKDYPFLALVEQTNFIEPKYYGGKHILYIGNYLPKGHRFLKMPADRLLKEFWPYLKKINAGFCRSSIIDCQLFQGDFAQAVIGSYYSKKILPFKTPLIGVYLVNMSQIYPWDRGVNYAVELGQRMAKAI